MKLKISFIATLLGLCTSLSLIPGIVAAQDDIAAGKLTFQTCAGCHAVANLNNVYPTYHVPKLAGQHADYIVSALQAYADKNRSHKTMHANAVDLTEVEVQNISAYLASMPVATTGNDVRGDLENGQAKAAGCESCHGANVDGGLTPKPPRLQGQHQDYLVHALQEYKSGVRQNAIMNGMSAALSAKDIKDVAAYYASQAGGVSTVSYYD